MRYRLAWKHEWRMASRTSGPHSLTLQLLLASAHHTQEANTYRSLSSSTSFQAHHLDLVPCIRPRPQRRPLRQLTTASAAAYVTPTLSTHTIAPSLAGIAQRARRLDQVAEPDGPGRGKEVRPEVTPKSHFHLHMQCRISKSPKQYLLI
ncbi:hypothetical protein B0H67DRAFT_548235 [Lasiosphaeris hirsuta]|uniref:Uncharacterized protein n=1 Tax=Lasiosphaeris hirsuta TaxID=260670 RepID=A0AA40B9P2_9PEZI|nr:hypothetical protein B0H67DRAFT_548235 [Lasiosphaeris hirsuta]